MSDETQTATEQPTGLFGRLPRQKVFPLKFASEYLLGDPTAAATYPIDVTEGITDFGMMGNDQWSDCVQVAEVHLEMTTGAAAGAEAPAADSPLALQRAQQFAGFGDTPPGPGTIINEYLHDLYVAGVILGWCPIDHTNEAEVDRITQEGIGVILGVDLFASNMSQFNAHQPLDADGNGPQLSMGHGVVLVKKVALGEAGSIITWAVVADVTPAWLQGALHQNTNGEAYLVITTEEQKAKFSAELFTDLDAIGGGDAPAEEPTPPEVVPEPEPEDPPAPEPEPGNWLNSAEGLLARLEAATGYLAHEVVELIERSVAEGRDIEQVIVTELGRTPRINTLDPSIPPPPRN